MKKVLVTGAAGRVGANVCLKLAEAGTLVRGMVLPNDPLAKKLVGLPNVEIVEADLTDQASVSRVVKGVTSIIHMAAQLRRGDTPVDKFFDINAFSTLRLLHAAAEEGILERFVLASTDGTYRPGDINRENPIKETSCQLPGDYYGTGKYLGEVILRNMAYQFDIPFSIVRFATVICPEESLNYYRYEYMKSLLELAHNGKDSHVWPLFVGQPDMAAILIEKVPAMDNPTVNFIGPKGTWTLHVADVRDIIQGIMLAYEHPKALGEDFLIAGPETTTYDEASKIITERLGVPRYEVNMPVTWRLDMDISKAKRILGFKPEWSFDKMLDSGIDAIKNGVKGFIPAK
jgi:UDP-glucose 4-epimerase